MGFGQFFQDLAGAAIDVGAQVALQRFLPQPQAPPMPGGGGFGGAGGQRFIDIGRDFPAFLPSLPGLAGAGGGCATKSVPIPATANLFHRTCSGNVVANRMVRVTNPGTGSDQWFLPAIPKTWKTPVRGVSGPRRHHHHPR